MNEYKGLGGIKIAEGKKVQAGDPLLNIAKLLDLDPGTIGSADPSELKKTVESRLKVLVGKANEKDEMQDIVSDPTNPATRFNREFEDLFDNAVEAGIYKREELDNFYPSTPKN